MRLPARRGVPLGDFETNAYSHSSELAFTKQTAGVQGT